MSDQTWRVTAAEAGMRLDKWLADGARLGSRSRAFAAIERGKVFVNDAAQTASDAGRRLQPGETVRLWMDRPGSAKLHVVTDRRVDGLHIVYEDDALLVINKPPGLLTVNLPAEPDEPSLVKLAAAHLRKLHRPPPHIVHRIDRDTSGLVVFAKTPAAREALKAQFAARTPERVYWAFVYGCPEIQRGEWRDWLVWDEKMLVQRAAQQNDKGASEAICHYRVLEKFGRSGAGALASLIEVRLVTGKQNQIRAQAARRGHQLVGERKYLAATAPPAPISFARQALHAARLGLGHPADRRPLSFAAPMPPDLAALRARLRGIGGGE
jgi:23S rRNA pseudouridine1911/1915/1917 synthase